MVMQQREEGHVLAPCLSTVCSKVGAGQRGWTVMVCLHSTAQPYLYPCVCKSLLTLSRGPCCLCCPVDRYEAYSQRLAAALTQQPGSPVPLEELVVILFAVQNGLVDSVQPSGVSALLQKGLDWLRQHNPQVWGHAVNLVQVVLFEYQQLMCSVFGPLGRWTCSC